MTSFEYYYKHVFCRDMIVKLNYSNSFECVKFTKCQINFTSKYIISDKKQLLLPFLALKMVSGQEPKIIRAKKSMASFKVKAQNVIGCFVTLRFKKLFSFLQTLSQFILPRIRDFQYLHPRGYQQKKCVHIGLQNLLLFPQIEKNIEIFEHLSGCALTIETNSRSHKETMLLLTGFKFPCS